MHIVTPNWGPVLSAWVDNVSPNKLLIYISVDELYRTMVIYQLLLQNIR